MVFLSFNLSVSHSRPYTDIPLPYKQQTLVIMATIHSTDIVYATVSQRGKTLTSITLSGMTSIAQIITHIRSIVKDSIGIFTLSLRNSTQGWLQERNIILKPRPAATQLTLF